MSYHIRIFNGSDPEREEFERFGAGHYRNDPFFRPPSPPPDHATWILLRDDENAACGRAAVMTNPGISFSGRTTALVGWYECVEDPTASRTLFDGIAEESRRIGADYLLGPMNGDTWHSYRIALPSAASPFFLEPYNKPWYALQFEEAGFAPVASYHSSRIVPDADQWERVEAEMDGLREQGITIREIGMERFDEEVRRIYSISVEAFQANPFYTPISEEDVLLMYGPLRPVVDPEFALIAEDREGEAVGFVFAVRNLFAPANDSLVVKTAAVLPRLYGKGLGSLLIEMVHQRGIRKGYPEMIHALMGDENVSTRILRDRSETIRRYHLYGREL